MIGRGLGLEASIGSRLGRRILAVLILVMTGLSLLFLAYFVTAYRSQMIAENARASYQVNKLLEASLKNAMLNRDLPGLRNIVAELSKQQEIVSVAILDPKGEIRFASDAARVGETLMAVPPEDQLASHLPRATYMTNAAGIDILRTVNPVANEPRCQGCHGTVAEHPVNGLLVIDYVASSVNREALKSAFIMTLAGGIVLVGALAAIAAMLNRYVLKPIALLNQATARFAHGDLAARVQLEGNDELSLLGQRFNGMAGDIQAEVQALQVREDFLQKVIDTMPDGVRVIDRSFTILKVNAAYCAQLGTTPEEAIGRKCYESSHHLDAPCSPMLVTCPLAVLSVDGRTSVMCRHRHLRADRSELFVEVSAAIAVLDRDSRKCECVIESIRDLANQSEASHQQRLSEIGQVAAGIAHEIHNPLWSIDLALDGLSAELKSGHHPAADHYVEIAGREIKRCLDVTGRLLRISEPASPDQTLLDIADLTKDVVALVDYQAKQSGVAISLEMPGRYRAIANESDFGIVVLNLVQNAIHAMPGGGTLKISASRDGATVVLRFSDTGVGIPPEDLHRIFWPFWSRRADGSSGSGLGLSICKAAIERMSGTMTVESSVGKGTTFTISLPDADGGDLRG